MNYRAKHVDTDKAIEHIEYLINSLIQIKHSKRRKSTNITKVYERDLI